MGYNVLAQSCGSRNFVEVLTPLTDFLISSCCNLFAGPRLTSAMVRTPGGDEKGFEGTQALLVVIRCGRPWNAHEYRRFPQLMGSESRSRAAVGR